MLTLLVIMIMTTMIEQTFITVLKNHVLTAHCRPLCDKDGMTRDNNQYRQILGQQWLQQTEGQIRFHFGYPCNLIKNASNSQPFRKSNSNLGKLNVFSQKSCNYRKCSVNDRRLTSEIGTNISFLEMAFFLFSFVWVAGFSVNTAVVFNVTGK